MSLLKHVKSLFYGSQDQTPPKPDEARSGQWPKVRDEWLAKQPECQVCGATTNLNAHHIKPFHLFPELELDPHGDNLITLCEGGHHANCHLIWGHLLLDWMAWNPHVVKDAKIWREKIKNRQTKRE